MFKLFLKGIVIGIANIIPGVSGGTLAVILGVYEKLTEAIGNFFISPMSKKIEYGKFLFSLLLGALVGVRAFAQVIIYTFTNYPKSTASFFILLILVTLPCIIKNEDKRNLKNILFFVLGGVFTLIFIGINCYLQPNKSLIIPQITSLYLLKLFVCGVVAAGAMVIPGISGSLLLLMFGEYKNINFFIVNLNTTYVLPLFIFGLGVLLGLIFVSKLMNILIIKYRSYTLFFVTGIVLLSVVQIWINAIKA